MKTILAVCFATMLSLPAAHAAQRASAPDAAYPARPVRLIVPQAPGGSNDIMARYAAQHLAGRLGKPFIVDNRPGADALIGSDMAARAAHDGYTLLLASGAYTMNPAVRKMPFDPHRAFDWISMLGTGHTAFMVGPSLPVKSIKDVLEMAKAKPGQLVMASAGGFQHFTHVLFGGLSGQKFNVVLYKGGFPAMIDVMGGQAHITIGSIVQALSLIRAGKLRALATGGAKRALSLPELPTIAEAGVPGYEASNWWTIAAPAGTPPAVINLLSKELTAFLQMPETQKRFNDEGVELNIMTPAELRKMITADLAKWAKVAKDTGMQQEK
jgi:tripartite-type tricarboxylate transporter receptor subunit TctC